MVVRNDEEQSFFRSCLAGSILYDYEGYVLLLQGPGLRHWKCSCPFLMRTPVRPVSVYLTFFGQGSLATRTRSVGRQEASSPSTARRGCTNLAGKERTAQEFCFRTANTHTVVLSSDMKDAERFWSKDISCTCRKINGKYWRDNSN